MPGKSRPATPEQVRLLIGLSSLLGLPLVAFVMLAIVLGMRSLRSISQIAPPPRS